MKTALLLIDIQNDYFAEGKMPLVNMTCAVARAQELLNLFRKKHLPIFHIQHISTRPNATFFLPNTVGVEIHQDVQPIAGEVVIVKHYPNSFRQTNLHEQLQKQGIEKLVICGAMSHMCIDTTTRAAADLGYQCTVISDACATKNLSYNNISVAAQEVHAAYMAALNGLFSEVTLLANWNI